MQTQLIRFSESPHFLNSLKFKKNKMRTGGWGYTESWWRLNAASRRCQWEVPKWMVGLFRVDLAAIFSFLPPSLLEDVQECATRAYAVFHAAPRLQRCSSLAGVSLQPARECPCSAAGPVSLHMALSGQSEPESHIYSGNALRKKTGRNRRSSKMWSYLIIKSLHVHVWIGFCVTELFKQTRKPQAK